MRGLEQKSAKWRVVTRKSWAKTFRPTISNLFQTDWFISPKNALDGIFHEGYICA